MSKCTDLYLTKYDQLLLLGVEDLSGKNFCSSYNITSMINKPACYKNPEKPSCRNLIFTNCRRSFLNSRAIETAVFEIRAFHLAGFSGGKSEELLNQNKRSKNQLWVWDSL